MTLCPMHTLFRFLCDSSFWYHLSLTPLNWPSQGQTGHAVLFLVVFPGAWYKCMVYPVERKDGGSLSLHHIHWHHSLSSCVLGIIKCPGLKETPCQWLVSRLELVSWGQQLQSFLRDTPSGASPPLVVTPNYSSLTSNRKALQAVKNLKWIWYKHTGAKVLGECPFFKTFRTREVSDFKFEDM